MGKAIGRSNTIDLLIKAAAAVLLYRAAMRRLHLMDADYGRNLDRDGTPTHSPLDTRSVSQAENLSNIGYGIAMLQRTLPEHIKRVSDGLDPLNVIRDERQNRTIPTNAWNKILSPTEASVLQGEEV
jgi:hypothetical protein